MNLLVSAFPNVVVFVRLKPQTIQALLLKLCRKPWVVAPIGLDHHSAGRQLSSPEHRVDRVFLVPRVPAEPQLRTRSPDSRPQQVKASLSRRLRLFPPSPLEPFQRLHRVGCVVVHALEDHQTITGRLDNILEHLEAVSLIQTKGGQLRLNQRLGRLSQILLNFANADSPKTFPALAGFCQAVFNRQLGKEMRLPRTPPTPCGFVARRLKQRRENCRRLQVQLSHSGLTMVRVIFPIASSPSIFCSVFSRQSFGNLAAIERDHTEALNDPD